MKDTSELERRQGTETELDPGSQNKTRKPGTGDQLDPKNQTDTQDDDDDEADEDGTLTNEQLGET
jgi:hypothetical protein